MSVSATRKRAQQQQALCNKRANINCTSPIHCAVTAPAPCLGMAHQHPQRPPRAPPAAPLLHRLLAGQRLGQRRRPPGVARGMRRSSAAAAGGSQLPLSPCCCCSGGAARRSAVLAHRPTRPQGRRCPGAGGAAGWQGVGRPARGACRDTRGRAPARRSCKPICIETGDALACWRLTSLAIALSCSSTTLRGQTGRVTAPSEQAGAGVLSGGMQGHAAVSRTQSRGAAPGPLTSSSPLVRASRGLCTGQHDNVRMPWDR